ncbi:para-aminobenzoate synthase component I [Klebsiella pneumoniae subsp. ozaenae]|uniref:Para-aminobenzoate synthase component I n=1 Tax=Klebsiella pneumoniae subsp. ozaenae TaxID=574 RepID=A0A378BFV8_KLEPO|nr:para-aminobenzoate synthase component I [Klebsiella pneumoniae subsp. ozaenae]
MLSPAIITLPWRPDAAEHYFAPLSALPWAMLLHSGFADHPHNRFDILVAAPRATLLTRDEQTWVDDGETVVVSAEDPLQLLQQQLDRQPFTPQPHDDLPFLAARWDYSVTTWAVALSVSLRTRRPISRWRIWRWGSMTGRLSSTTQRQQISLLSYDEPAAASTVAGGANADAG